MATFSVGVTGLDKVLARMKDLPAKLNEAEKRATVRGQLMMERKWKQNARGPILNTRTGAYRASIAKQEAVKDAQGYRGTVGIVRGKSDKYAAIHETGGIIRAKKKLLAIPLSRTKAGVARDSTPLDYPDGFWFKSKAGNIIFAIPLGNGRIKPLFVGKPSVTIPARRPMGRTFDEIRPGVLAEFDVLVRRAINASR